MKTLFEQTFPNWLFAFLIFLVWMLLGLMLRRHLMKSLRELAKKTTHTLDDLLVESLNFPLGFIVFGSGIVISTRFLSLSPEINQIFIFLFQFSIIAAIVLFVNRLLCSAFLLFQDRLPFGIPPKAVQIILQVLVYGTAVMVFLDLIGVSITPLIASLGIGSLSVGLALQDTLTNFFSGIHISFDKPLRVGDYVKLESGQEGYVEEIGWRSTRIRMLSNNMIIVPNQKLTSSLVINYYLPSKEMAILVEVGVHYASDLEKVELITIEVARDVLKNVQGGVPVFDPFIRYHTFGESSVNFTVILRGKEFTDQYLVKHEFVKRLHKRYQQEGIVIPFPIRTLDFSPDMLRSLRSNINV